MPLTAHERETIISFNEGSGNASIFTHNRTWQRHLEETLGLKTLSIDGFGGRDYELPKRWIKLPRAPRNLSPSTKAKLANNFSKTCSRLAKSEDKTQRLG